ncbi:hypothetical protein KSC_018000 [Ktedonobacter sp. SOSP1-52]|nr:hypothetical protein KSC_018000 [Ktedonobacter sp. SOSP1-52]
MDEFFLTIHGERHYLWQAVDQDGNVLNILGPQAPLSILRNVVGNMYTLPFGYAARATRAVS